MGEPEYEKDMENDPQFRELIEKLRGEVRLGVWQLPNSGIHITDIPAHMMDGDFIEPIYYPEFRNERPPLEPMFEPFNTEEAVEKFPNWMDRIPDAFKLKLHVAMAIAWCGGSKSYCLGAFFNPDLAQEAVARAKENQKADSQGFDLKVFTVELGKMYKMWENAEDESLRPEIPECTPEIPE